ADFPMSSVVPKGNGFAIRRAQPALGAEDKELFPANFAWLPSHAGVLSEAKKVATGAVEQQLFRQGQASGSPGGLCLYVVNIFAARRDQIAIYAHSSILAEADILNTKKHRCTWVITWDSSFPECDGSATKLTWAWHTPSSCLKAHFLATADQNSMSTLV